MSGLFIVIPVFNGWQQTQRCLHALLDPTRETYRVIVVDHGSTDATATELLREFPEVIRIQAGEDLWWTGATNIGIRHAVDAEADAVMLLNNDCVIAGEVVEELAAYARREQSVVAPIQRARESGRVTYAGATMALALGFAPLRVKTEVPHETLTEVPLIVGGRGVVVPVSVIAKVGLFDEQRLPHYWADHDFYLRCRSAGVRLLLAGRLSVEVDEDRTSLAAQMAAMSWSDVRSSLSDRRSHRNFRDVTSFFKKHYPIRPLHHIGSVLYTVRYLVSWAGHRLIARLRSGARR